MEAVVWAWLHALSTLMMVGVIWFVQIVHYPLFAGVSADAWTDYHSAHMKRTSWVVGPTMLIEALSAVMLVAVASSFAQSAVWSGLALLAMVWAVTFAVMVPLHNRLDRGFDAGVITRMVRMNWIRTCLWSVRGVLALWVLARTQYAHSVFNGVVH